jgi:hypothetical protein
MTISTRKPTATSPKTAAAKKPAAKKAAAPPLRRASAAVANSPVTPVLPVEAKKPVKIEKRIRTSFALPESQVALLGELKKRCLGFGVNVKKGELLTAGLQLLNNLTETALEAAVLPSMRSGRQRKTGKKRKK